MTILSLALKPLDREDIIATSEIKIYFTVSLDPLNASVKFNPSEPEWRERKLTGSYYKTNDLFNQLQDMPVSGKRLIEFVWYENISMWQFLPSYIWPSFYQAIGLIDLLISIIDEAKPTSIIVFPVDDITAPIWLGVVQAIGEKYGIEVLPKAYVGVSLQRFRGQIKKSLQQMGFSHIVRLIKRLVIASSYFFKRQHQYFIAHCFSRYSTMLQQELRGRKKLLCVTLGKRHWVGTPGNTNHKYDEQFFPLFPALRDKGWKEFLMIDCQDSSIVELEARNTSGEAGVCWRSFSSYMKGGLRSFLNAKAVFIKMFRELVNDSLFLESFQYRGIHLMPALKSELKYAFNDILPDCVDMLNIASRIIHEERPDAVMLTYETGPWERALIIEAGQAGIPTVGLQHGMIFDFHYDYMHSRISNDPVNNPFGFIVPKVTCVWGPIWKRNLTEAGHYRHDMVAITGNWRYDSIKHNGNDINTDLLKQNYGYAPGKKIILILSGGQNTGHYINHCLRVLHEQPDCLPLVKLHPADAPAPIEEMLHSLGQPKDIIVGGLLSDKLIAADIVISQASTAVAEAILMGKIVVLVNFEKSEFCKAYGESGACLYVDSPDNLGDAIKKGLYDASLKPQFKKIQDKFIDEFYYKIDGCSAKRVAAILETLLN